MIPLPCGSIIFSRVSVGFYMLLYWTIQSLVEMPEESSGAERTLQIIPSIIITITIPLAPLMSVMSRLQQMECPNNSKLWHLGQ